MFKKLKNRLLITNIIVITIILTITFTGVYLTTYENTQRGIHNALKEAANSNPKDPIPNNDKDERLPLPLPDGSSPDRKISFVLNLSDQNEILSVYSFFNEEDAFYNNALTLALAEGMHEGQIELGETNWAYMFVPRKDFHQLFFVDITPHYALLNRLLITFIIVSLTMIVVIIFMSNYLTNQSLKPIKRSFRQQNQFISDASHELKTPLTVINTNVDVLLNGTNDENQTKWLKYIQTEVSRMTKLTDDLLYLSRFESKSVHEALVPVNLTEIIEHQLLGLEAVAFEKQLSLNYNLSENLQTLGNAEQLSQLVMILLENALKYTAEKGYVNVTAEIQQNHIILSVKNNGHGIHKDNLDKIFDRFYKEDVSRQHKDNGYGLGLSIAQSIVLKHHGKITCESDTNQETTFTVKLINH